MISVILLAWGSSSRFWKNKLKALLWWVPVFLYSLLKFHKREDISEIIIVSSENEIEDYKILQKQFPKIKFVVKWWIERQFSVQNWLEKVSWEFVLIHNWANPLVTDKEIDEVILNTKKYWASVVWKKVKNTLKKVDENWFVISTIPREDIFEVQTPQWLKTEKFKELVEKNSHPVIAKRHDEAIQWNNNSTCHPELVSGSEKIVINWNKNNKIDSEINSEWQGVSTDDVSFFEKENLPVKIVESSEQNFKITTQEDLKKAESFVRQNTRIWFWHDSHKIIENKSWNWMILWWIKISNDLEFEWNSDWDVLIHAICNGIWTAIWEWSLSIYSDKMCKDWITNSMEYLKHIVNKMTKKWYSIWNISASIEWAKPKLEKHIPTMKEEIAQTLFCTTFQIWIACTTWEWLTSFWKWEWLQVFCNVILKKV